MLEIDANPVAAIELLISQLHCCNANIMLRFKLLYLRCLSHSISCVDWEAFILIVTLDLITIVLILMFCMLLLASSKVKEVLVCCQSKSNPNCIDYYDHSYFSYRFLFQLFIFRYFCYDSCYFLQGYSSQGMLYCSTKTHLQHN